MLLDNGNEGFLERREEVLPCLVDATVKEPFNMVLQDGSIIVLPKIFTFVQKSRFGIFARDKDGTVDFPRGGKIMKVPK